MTPKPITLDELIEHAGNNRNSFPPARGPKKVEPYLASIPTLDDETRIGTLGFERLTRADQREVEARIAARREAIRLASIANQKRGADVSRLDDCDERR